MKPHAYPDWVYQYRTKGTTIKKVGGNYYLYRTFSKRVPGKNYPVTTSEYIGLITKEGVISSQKRKLTSDQPVVYEYGFSYALDQLAYTQFRKEYYYKEDARAAFIEILKKHSENTWYVQEQAQQPEQVHLNISLQERKIERIIGCKISDLYALKYVYAVVIGQRIMISRISEQAQQLLDKIGVQHHEPE